MQVRLKQIIPAVFWPVHRAISAGTVQEVVAKGGRGSGKSSYVSLELVYRLLRTPDCHAVVLRKVAGTLRNSVYNQILWAIQTLGCAAYFRCTVSPMECTYLPTGQKILFFGLDDAGKLKSLKLPFGAVGLCWFEELDQFDGAEEVRNVEQSLLRGGGYSLTFKSFNPPAMARSWANRYALQPRDGKLVHHSTYRDLPRAWLGERFWADAEHLKAVNPDAYRHEYGGEVVGNRTRAKVVKNKVAPPFREAEFDIMYGEGIAHTGELIDLGVRLGIITKAGSWFSMGEVRIGQGRDAAKKYLEENPDIAADVEAQIRANFDKLMGNQSRIAAAKAAGKAVNVSADDFNDED